MSIVEINKNKFTCYTAYGGLHMHSPVAPVAARILSSNAEERGPRSNAKFGN